MKYHSFTAMLSTLVSNEELEKEKSNTKRDSGDGLECDQIDNHQNTGPHR